MLNKDGEEIILQNEELNYKSLVVNRKINNK